MVADWGDPRLLRAAESARSKGRPSPYSLNRSKALVKSGLVLLASRMVKVVVILDSHPQKDSSPPDLQMTIASPFLLASHTEEMVFQSCPVTGTARHRTSLHKKAEKGGWVRG